MDGRTDEWMDGWTGRQTDGWMDRWIDGWMWILNGQNIWTCTCTYIREYGNTLYVGMAWKKNGHPYISIASDELKSLLK